MLKTPPESLLPAFQLGPNLCPDYRSDLGDSKRMLERWVADSHFRDLCRQDPRGAAAQFHLRANPEELRPLWNPNGQRICLTALSQDPNQALSLRRYCAFLLEKFQFLERMRQEGAPAHPAFRAWRQRQIERCNSELASRKGQFLVHAPFVLELGLGCSVGCWFCAVSAPKLGEQFTYNASNAVLWRDCLAAIQEVVGETAGRWGYCYWGTDPLDNPDYESFLLDFHRVLGAWPQTTTAQAHKHIERARQLLELGKRHGGYLDRFSVVALSHWQRLHDAFTPSELTFVECIAQNKESTEPKAVAGRAFAANRKLAARGQQELVDERLTSTIACVSGFMLNMVTRQVSVITPCNASQSHPDGFYTLGSRSFACGPSLRRALLDLIDECMPLSLGHEHNLSFRHDLDYSPESQGFRLTDRGQNRSFGHPAWAQLGQLLSQGQHTAPQIAEVLSERLGLSWEESFYRLNQLFDAGLLNERTPSDPNQVEKGPITYE